MNDNDILGEVFLYWGQITRRAIGLLCLVAKRGDSYTLVSVTVYILSHMTRVVYCIKLTLSFVPLTPFSDRVCVCPNVL